MGKVIFVSGIDTDVGKTVATGIYAKKLMEQGFSVITQKMIQTVDGTRLFRYYTKNDSNRL